MVIKIMVNWLANEFENCIIYIRALIIACKFLPVFSIRMQIPTPSPIYISISDAKFYNSTQRNSYTYQ